MNEITDNVLVHSQSPIGGIVQVSTFQKAKKLVEYIVVDAGVGIPKTLRQSHPELSPDTAALDLAIREGVTRDRAVDQGNGFSVVTRSAATAWAVFSWSPPTESSCSLSRVGSA